MLDFKDEIDVEVPQDDSTTFEEKLVLYSLIRALQPKVVLETGTHRGKTSLYIANALYDNGFGHLHTCDPFDFDQPGNIRKFPMLGAFMTFHKLAGKDLDVRDIDFAFIDGYHDKQTVIDEMHHFLPRLTPHAVVVFHDCDDVPESWEAMVNGAIKELGLKTVYLLTQNRLRIYEHSQI